MPAVALFTSRDVAVGEELTFAYGPPNGVPRARCVSREGAGSRNIVAQTVDISGNRARPCRCGTSTCLGYLPSEVL